MRAHCAQYETYMQIAGKGRCLAGDRLRKAIARSSALHQVLLRYVQVFPRQTTETALANGRGNIAHRRSRVTVLDREGLEEGSNGAYSRPTVERSSQCPATSYTSKMVRTFLKIMLARISTIWRRLNEGPLQPRVS